MVEPLVLEIDGELSRHYLIKQLEEKGIKYHIIGFEVYIFIEGMGDSYKMLNLLTKLGNDSFKSNQQLCDLCKSDLTFSDTEIHEGRIVCNLCYEVFFKSIKKKKKPTRKFFMYLRQKIGKNVHFFHEKN